jgi:hypothetical protein
VENILAKNIDKNPYKVSDYEHINVNFAAQDEEDFMTRGGALHKLIWIFCF